MKVESGISGRRDAVDWLVIESIAQKEESVNRYYHKFDIVLNWEMRLDDEQAADLTLSNRQILRPLSKKTPLIRGVFCNTLPAASWTKASASPARLP